MAFDAVNIQAVKGERLYRELYVLLWGWGESGGETKTLEVRNILELNQRNICPS